MYELIEITEYEFSRFIKLRNIDTGIVEECFDDSAIVSKNNFDFMQIGKQYECKIKLFGKPVAEKTNNSVICVLVDNDLKIGQKNMVKVQVNNSNYYIMRKKVAEYLDCESFNFCFTRKDLVQVDSVIHADLLKE